VIGDSAMMACHVVKIQEGWEQWAFTDLRN
jgi:hypothetical protein